LDSNDRLGVVVCRERGHCSRDIKGAVEWPFDEDRFSSNDTGFYSDVVFVYSHAANNQIDIGIVCKLWFMSKLILLNIYILRAERR
jgi:hypothetical protein